MNAYILDLVNDQLVEAEILLAEDFRMPLKKDGWNFNWRSLSKETNTQTFILRLKGVKESIEGILLLKIENEMLIMDVVEIAPHNIGSQTKRFDFVAGCLISYACKESLKIDSNYKGYLTFVSKTNLIGWYSSKYGAEQGLGQRMFISPQNGFKLIDEYLNREK